MILYYALGGGLGHLTRARRVLGALGEEAALLTASCYARDPRVVGSLPVVFVPPPLGRDRGAFRRWLERTLDELGPDELIVDSFPGGILGELCGMALPPARHVARRLNWGAYAQRLDGPLPRYDAVYAVEPVAHPLPGPVEPLALATEAGDAPLVEEPHWLVVHSGPEAELATLLEHAAGAPRVLVVSPHRPARLPAHARWSDVYPVAPHLGGAERIVTAAGFNAMHETAPWRERHTFVPFERALDDQFARAALA